MSYITIDNLNCINAELSNYCNAACPMCSRYDWNLDFVEGKVNNAYTKLEVFEEKIGKKVIGQLKKFYSCGTYGDGSTNPECLEIYEFLRKHNQTVDLTLHSNGGTRTKDFWAELAKMNVRVVFAIDGLEGTNHLYRRNVKWDKLMANVESFISHGGVATWQYLIFKHNQKQEKEARDFAMRLGFRNFLSNYSIRWQDFDSEGNFRDISEIDLGDYKLEKPEQPRYISSKDAPLKHDKEQSTREEVAEKIINCQHFFC